jgi:hypothetical protein
MSATWSIQPWRASGDSWTVGGATDGSSRVKMAMSIQSPAYSNVSGVPQAAQKSR